MRGERASRHRPALLYTYIYGEVPGPCPLSAMGWGLAPTGPHMPIPICMGKSSGPCPLSAMRVGASPHRPPPPFLVLTQEKAPAGAGKFAWYIRRDRARDEIRKTCVATLRFGHSDFRARPCNSSFRALGDRCRSSGYTMVGRWFDG